MGSGDLNMKKSWHPQRSGNVAATHKAEAEAIAERKKLQQRLQEIEEERKKEEIQKALEAAGGKPRLQRVEWMYSGPTDGQAGDAAENEAYLLGKRRIDKLLQDNDVKKLQKSTQDSAGAAPVPAIANARDVATKIREDPMLAIKRQEQQAYEAMMKDPIRRRQLLASMGIDDTQDKSKRKEERRHKHRHTHRSHRHRDERESDKYSRRHRSDSRDRSRSPRRRDSVEDDRRRRRRDSRDRRRERSVSTDSRDRSSEDRRDKRDTRDRRSRSRDGVHKDRRSRVASRSASPPRRRRDYSADRHDRGKREQSGERSGGYNPRSGNSYNNSRKYDDDRRDRAPPRQDRHPQRPSGGATADREKAAQEERARKLAAMQEAATDLDKDREQRLALLADQERAEQESDDRARQRNKRFGGDAGFMNDLHSRAAELKVADRVGRR
ncbi:pre-mRNA-splicing factor CWC25 [Chaetomium sp. MPI-SDFR-AT-0129]|nr:pre-mRNA-splicing factor CWC25 [Chaetomium sp. MPI-SDFR-AT-0129]